MLLSHVVLALTAVASVAALPAPQNRNNRAPAFRPPQRNQPKKAPVRLQPARKTAAKKGSKVPKPYRGKNKGAKPTVTTATTTTTAVVTTTNAAGVATTTTTTAAAVVTTPAAVNTAQDSGVTNVIEGCTNADGETNCFEILGDLKNSCFTIPRPLANNVAFWLPPPGGVCSLFTDELCTVGQQAALGPVANIASNSWSCVDAATAAAAASSSSASTTTTTTTTTSTTAAARTAVASAPAKNESGKGTTSSTKPQAPPSKAPVKLQPAKKTPAKKGSKVPKPYKGKNKGGKATASTTTTTTTAVVTTTNAAGVATTTTTTAAAVVTAPPNVNTAQDSGVTNVIQGCKNPDGVTECFQILGDLKNSCFTIPRPLAGDVEFFLPPPGGVCALFSDELCKNDQEAALGVISNKAANSWSCVDAATAAAAASSAAVSTTTTTTTTSTTAAARTAVASAPAKGNTSSTKPQAPPKKAPVKLQPAKKTPAKKGSKVPKPYKGKNKGGKATASTTTTTTTAVVTTTNAAGVATTTTTTAAAVVTAPPVVNTAQDSGVTNVIQGCKNPDGETECFQILGDLKNSCFTIPRPLAGDVEFFLPPPGGVCALFSDELCKNDQEAALGVISNKAANSWSCVDAATAAAAASSASASTTTTTTDAAANTAVATAPPVNTLTDTGITNVIEGCVNPDGVTECFEILGDTKESCFTIPNPLANQVAFFLPPPGGVCQLFSDENCTKDAEAALGQIKNVKANSWSCTAAAAAA